MPQLTQQFSQTSLAGSPAGAGSYYGSQGSLAAPQSLHQHVNLLSGPQTIDFEASTSVIEKTLPSSRSASQSPTSNCAPVWKRSTINSVPTTQQVLNKSRIPFGLLVKPYRQLLPGEEEVPVINAPQVVRCRRCRTYINPWVTFIEQGHRWKCNLCFLTNDVPSFFDWNPDTRQNVDRMQRPELTHAVVEFVAPQEYMVRPPQPVVMLFLIDVSFNAIQSGMVAAASKAILSSLQSIPNTEDRTKIAIITFDSNLQFYNLSSVLNEPQMLVMSDHADPFLPQPYDLLVSLTESMSQVQSLLGKLPEMFKHNTDPGHCLGTGLTAARKLISPIGGKIIVLSNSLPNTGEGSLKMREDVSLLGTNKETTLLHPQTAFYKNLAVTCSPSQVSVDMFLFSNDYADIATLNGCAKFTAGATYYYKAFNAKRPEDSVKFTTELSHFLGRALGLEAVLRIRASRGVKMTAFHGNFFLRSTDLLSLPNVSTDNAYAVECQLTETIVSPLVCFQTAVLHTSSNGERRIRVLTLALNVTTSIADVFTSADQVAIASLLAKKGVDRTLTSKIEDARDAIQHKLIDILGAYKQSMTSSGQAGQLLTPANLRLLPLLCLGLLKMNAFRDTATIPSDLRSYWMALLYVFPADMIAMAIHPQFYALHTVLDADAQPPMAKDALGRLPMPKQLNLSSERLDRQGVFLLDNGVELFLWVGSAVPPATVHALFDRPSVDQVQVGKASLSPTSAQTPPLGRVVRDLIAQIRADRMRQMTLWPHLYIVREDGDPSLKTWFLSHLVEDRYEKMPSYPQFLNQIREGLAKYSSG
ncbi:hypothetical protein CXG81DRAFT_9982 [Caulochytrium protostelioides]|uniref:Uncharacterized protein n=1 Tax=Caulochytrium protostelioides TaxID=1555241 RepID=A0A4P9XCC7_9FUNG|nr:hypothetical protein CXG81DRAFT_9982 [Caulochytrium protostelioides]|eukprot:RKP03088.1 hypothetical protein CXG81DRAFT_9982 [Caulochytrium protostelioides]